MKYTLQISFEKLRADFKNNPHDLEYKLNHCTYEVFISKNAKYGVALAFMEVNSIDDVVQCILKYA